MRKLYILLLLWGTLPLVAAPNQDYIKYIDRWRKTAEAQEKAYGIPAAITLAQGLLESQAGQSELAQNANNHFGIKCTRDWDGEQYYHDDDENGECFRVYRSAADSYRDHSLFLKRDRYKACFEIPVSDYAAWARKIRECGYATDPKYADKLIRIIEEYGLADKTKTPQAPLKGEESMAQTENKESKKTLDVKAFKALGDLSTDTITGSVLEERDDFFKSHPRKHTNLCTYVVAQEGDTWSNVAFRLNKKERTLRRYNDAMGRTLQPGDRIYLFWKRPVGVKEHAILWVHPGEEVWMICQREAIREKKLRKYNYFPADIQVFKTRQKIYTRKHKEEK